jgi:multidrug efflux system outer membrane protein
MKQLFFFLFGMVLLLSGCAVGPDYQRPGTELPTRWPESSFREFVADADGRDWWLQFEDPILTGLVDRALAENLSLRLQLYRIQETRARLGSASAQRRPSLDAQAEGARQQESGALSTGSVGNSFSLSGLLSYEVDLWGRLARGQESAEALLAASRFNRDAVRLRLITDLVSTYINLRAAQEQLRITENTLTSRYNTLQLQQIRYDGGVIDQLGLQQAQSEWEATRALLPRQQEQVRLLESALAILTGMSPAEFLGELDFGEGQLTDLRLARTMPDFLPSELLLRRPDIRAAEANLIAANAQIGVATAERLPRFNLALFYGSAAGDLNDLLSHNAEIWGASGSLLAPLVDFGRNQARVEIAEALRDQDEVRYQITVQTAFREVRNALLLSETATQRETAIRRQMESVRKTLQLVELRYQEGYSSFIEVLDAQRQLLTAELALTEATRDRYNAAAAMFNALGGGW